MNDVQRVLDAYAQGVQYGGLACMAIACYALVRTAWGKR